MNYEEAVSAFLKVKPEPKKPKKRSVREWMPVNPATTNSGGAKEANILFVRLLWFFHAFGVDYIDSRMLQSKTELAR